MISAKLVEGLNDQIEMEASASFLYLSMSIWAESKGLKGCASFLRRQSSEENMHMLKIIDYLLEVDQSPIVPSINKPESHFESIGALMKHVYEHEQRVTQSIFKLLEMCLKEEDFATHNFLQWYVTEQREEESLMREILDKIKLIGDGPQSLYYIDKELIDINNSLQANETNA